jgi:hypothetical protein
MSPGIRLLGAAALVTALACGNVVRETCWTQVDGFLCGPFATRPIDAVIAPIAVAGLTRVELAAPEWRPLALDLRVSGAAVRVSERAGDRGTVVDPGRPVWLEAQRPPTPDSRLALWAEPVAGAASNSAPAASIVLRVAAVTPVLAPGRTIAALAVGAAAAVALAWALLFGRRGPDGRPAATEARVADGAATWIAPIALLAVVHGAWLVLKPPLQSPDEPQHHARATSAPQTPYIAGARTVTVAAARRNPLTWTPNRLHAIIFTPAERLSDDDIRTLRATVWPAPGTHPARETLPSPIASYPPLYYWLVFAGGELATWLLALSPYASLLAYRAASVLVAGGLWLTIHALMRRTPDLRAWALPAFIVLIANPVTASITSSVNPDALVIPATVLLLLATWRRLTADGSQTPIVASALLAVAVKPSGMLAVVVAAVGVLWWMARRPDGRAAGVAILRLLTLVAITAWLAFYAWSPPRLVIEGSHAGDSPLAFAGTVIARAPAWWVEYWGRLGWLEYSASPLWYWLLFGTCVMLILAALWRPAPDGGLRSFLLVTGLAYVGLLVTSEYTHLRTAPLFIQGRYLLPVSLCLVPLVRQKSLAVAWTLPALLVGLNVALAQATIARYFAGGWPAWLASLV